MASSPIAALRARAIELHAAGKAREAESAYEQVLAEDPADADCLAALASLRLARGLATEAVALCERALAIDARLAAALINRANALRALGRTTQALESYERCVAAHPA